MRSVIVDANALVSFFIDRVEKQREAAEALLRKAEEGEITVIVPQFVVFEMAYVLLSQYGVSRDRLSAIIRDVIAFPGVDIVDHCPWKRVMELWPDPLPGLADATMVALAMTDRHDAVATFDRKLANKLRSFGLEPYF